MPGLLVMDQQAIAVDSLESNHDRAHSSLDDFTDSASLKTNGVKREDSAQARSDGQNGMSNGSADAESGKNGSLPELDDSWRRTPANKPFGLMLERMGQMCYSDLQDLVTKLGEDGGKEAQKPNGIVKDTAEDTDATSLKHKRAVLSFASEWRDRFVKALVISDWSRTSGEDVARLIDLRNTLMKRLDGMAAAIQAVGDLKRETTASRAPAYNLNGAIQYLGTGRSSNPDLNLLRPSALKAQEILDLLERMNAMANLRICLHEPDLPKHMNEYDIANGRVTFKVPGEFEIDLACLDEEPEKTPWYFIDFRFDFSPAPKRIHEGIRSHLEQSINAAAASKQLQGCYDFCHQFILDQKIVELESQAQKLIRGRWSDTLRVQRLRRVLTVSYWRQKKASKASWLEFGVHNDGIDKDPQLSVRHFREGVLLTDDKLLVSWNELSLEKILYEVTKQHTREMLDAVCSIVAKKCGNEIQILREVDLGPYDNSLAVTLLAAHPSCPKRVECFIEPYSGTWRLAPKNPQVQAHELNMALEPDINRIAHELERFVSSTLQYGVEFEALLNNWTVVKDIAPPPNKEFRMLFGSAVEVTFLKPNAEGSMILACATSLAGQTWYLLTLNASRQISKATQLQLPALNWTFLLANVVDVAGEQVQYRQASAQLPSISYSTGSFMRRQGLMTEYLVEGKAYFFKFDDLMRQRDRPGARKWAHDPVRVSTGKFSRGKPGALLAQREVRLMVKSGRLTTLLQHLREHRIRDLAVLKDESGLSLLVHVPLDVSYLDVIQAALISIAELDSSIAVLKQLGMQLDEVDMEHIALSYGAEHRHSMRVSYSKGRKLPLSLKVSSPATNPHQRIRIALENILSKDGPNAFGIFAHTIANTLPLLRAIEAAEQSASSTLLVHVRNAMWYSFKYRGSTNIGFTVRARSRQDGDKREIRWHVEQDRSYTTAVPDALTTALKEFFTRRGIEGTIGLRNSLATTSAGIEAAIQKLNSIVSPFVKPVAASTIKALPKPAETVTTAPVAKQDPASKEEEGEQQDVIMLD